MRSNKLKLQNEIVFNDCIIKEYAFTYESGFIYDLMYSVYDINGVFITNYFNKTLKQVKRDLLEY